MESAFSPAVINSEIIKCHLLVVKKNMNVITPEPFYSAYLAIFLSSGGLIIFIWKERGAAWCGKWKKNISSGVLRALRSTPMTSLTAGCFKAEREEKKTLDNHQCLQYLSSKRLKAHIAYNWIWFALPASVREIKGKHKNPHDSFSSRWQARPNRSWKEYLWRKPSHRGCWKWQSWGTMNT